jgi:2-iminobutanoate/2-iminopropanoate deaminase
MSEPSRRGFLVSTCAAGSAAAVIGGTAGAVAAAEPRSGRRAIGGSPIAVFSRAVVFDRLVYVSGVVGNRAGTLELAGDDFAAQCRQAMDNLKGSVEAAGTRMEHVLKCTCFLTEASHFAEFNRIYRTYFSAEPPARSTVVVKALVVEGAKLEIDCVACLP